MMRQPEVRVFLLDGLNNTGKTTQLKLLRHTLANLGIHAAVKKGDGSRRGLGLHDYDPHSVWWQHHRREALAVGTEGDRAEHMATVASRTLLTELVDFKEHDFPDELRRYGHKRGVVLLDRGHISRIFVSRRSDPMITFAQAMGIDRYPRLAGSLPDKAAVLHASREVLLARTEHRDDNIEKKRFNDEVISKYYDDFEATIHDLPPELAQMTSIIDAAQGIEEVNRIVRDSIQEMY